MPTRPEQHPEITVNEWFRPWDFLWLAAIAAIVWITVAVPAGDLVPVGNNSAFPKYADTHRAPLLIPLFAVLGWVGLKLGCRLKSPLAARLDQHGIKLYADTTFGLRTKIGPPRAEAPLGRDRPGSPALPPHQAAQIHPGQHSYPSNAPTANPLVTASLSPGP